MATAAVVQSLPQTLGEYSPNVWEKIPLESQAFTHFQKHPLEPNVWERIRSVFLAHQVEESLCLTLIHRHFALAADERVVEYNGVATPWKIESRAIVPLQHRISPQKWAFIDGKLCPYEFVFEGDNDASMPQVDFSDAFLKDFHSILQEYNLEGVFGLSSLLADKTDLATKIASGRKMEVTTGRTSITIQETKDDQKDDVIETSWVYPRLDPLSGGGPMPVPYGFCIRCCRSCM